MASKTLALAGVPNAKRSSARSNNSVWSHEPEVEGPRHAPKRNDFRDTHSNGLFGSRVKYSEDGTKIGEVGILSREAADEWEEYLRAGVALTFDVADIALNVQGLYSASDYKLVGELKDFQGVIQGHSLGGLGIAVVASSGALDGRQIQYFGVPFGKLLPGGTAVWHDNDYVGAMGGARMLNSFFRASPTSAQLDNGNGAFQHAYAGFKLTLEPAVRTIF